MQVSATQEKSWKIYKSHILMAIPSMPRVLGIRKYKQTSENALDMSYNDF